MNGKISSGEVLSICVAIIFAMFPGFANNLILSEAKNASLLSLGISFIVGLIPILMIMYISKKIDTNFATFAKNSLNWFGYILDFILLLVAIFTIFLSSWLAIDFIISQFLTRSSYYLMSIPISIVIAITVNKGIEVLSRTVFILFIISVPILLFLLGTLIPYVDIQNLKPYIDVPFNNIFPSNVFTINVIGISSIGVYHILSFIILSLVSNISYDFMLLINIILHTIFLNFERFLIDKEISII